MDQVLKGEKLKNVFVLVISGAITVLQWTLEEDPLGHVSTEVSRYPPGPAQTQEICPWEGKDQVVHESVGSRNHQKYRH